MTARFTFAVCVKCGVQSQPILMLDADPLEVDAAVRSMGWRMERMKFSVSATCPVCLEREDAKAVHSFDSPTNIAADEEVAGSR